MSTQPEYAGLPALPPMPVFTEKEKKRGRGPDKKKRAPGSGGARPGSGKPGGPGPRAVAITLRVPPAVAEAFKAWASAAGMSQPKFFAAALDSYAFLHFPIYPTGIRENNTPQADELQADAELNK